MSCADIEDLPPNVQEKLFDEVLDRDVQKGKKKKKHNGNIIIQVVLLNFNVALCKSFFHKYTVL